jgi:hypothetical protein
MTNEWRRLPKQHSLFVASGLIGRLVLDVTATPRDRFATKMTGQAITSATPPCVSRSVVVAL